MNIQKIYDLIKNAHKEESVGRHLSKLINYRMEYLHDSIKLPNKNSKDSIHSFLCGYIYCTPKIVEVIYREHKESCTNGFLAPFIAIIEDNFLLVEKHTSDIFGLDTLINKAFFALRLLEDLNDIFIIQTKAVLITQSLTKANLIAHEILGEPFANDIDNTVQKTIENFSSHRKVNDTNEILITTSTAPRKTEMEDIPQYFNLSINTDFDLSLPTIPNSLL